MKKLLLPLSVFAIIIFIIQIFFVRIRSDARSKIIAIKKESLQLNNKSIDKKVEPELKDTLEEDKVSKKLIKLIELYHYMDIPEDKKAIEAFEVIKELKENPKETFETIKDTASYLPSKHETEKQFIYQLANELDINKNDKKDFFKQDFFKLINKIHYEKTNQSIYTASIIFELFSKNSDNTIEIEETLMAVIDKSPEALKKLLLDTFSSIDPERAKEISKLKIR